MVAARPKGTFKKQQEQRGFFISVVLLACEVLKHTARCGKLWNLSCCALGTRCVMVWRELPYTPRLLLGKSGYYF